MKRILSTELSTMMAVALLFGFATLGLARAQDDEVPTSRLRLVVLRDSDGKPVRNAEVFLQQGCGSRRRIFADLTFPIGEFIKQSLKSLFDDILIHVEGFVLRKRDGLVSRGQPFVLLHDAILVQMRQPIKNWP